MNISELKLFFWCKIPLVCKQVEFLRPTSMTQGQVHLQSYLSRGKPCHSQLHRSRLRLRQPTPSAVSHLAELLRSDQRHLWKKVWIVISWLVLQWLKKIYKAASEEERATCNKEVPHSSRCHVWQKQVSNHHLNHGRRQHSQSSSPSEFKNSASTSVSGSTWSCWLLLAGSKPAALSAPPCLYGAIFKYIAMHWRMADMQVSGWWYSTQSTNSEHKTHLLNRSEIPLMPYICIGIACGSYQILLDCNVFTLLDKWLNSFHSVQWSMPYCQVWHAAWKRLHAAPSSAATVSAASISLKTGKNTSLEFCSNNK